ncbi:hypothetical protein SLA2020_236550 [Shorea laevis]
MAAPHDFSGNYLILRTDEVSVLDLLRILLNGELEKKAFVECPLGKEENYRRRRWLIFMSLLGQKFLRHCATCMAWIGAKFEMWLNLVSSNGNIFVLFLNFLRGNVVKPHSESENFLSFVGHVDTRVDLDKNIKPEDRRYYEALAVMAAKLSYENEAFVKKTVRDCWKMELLGYYNFWNDYQGKKTTEGFMFYDQESDTVVVAFRGTEVFDADAWSTDIDISWYELPQMGKIHGGFMKALGLVMSQGWPSNVEPNDDRPLAYYTIREKLREVLTRNNETKFIMAGHSLGGALAVLFPAVLALHEETSLLQRLEGVYTFGQPRVGNEDFKSFMENQIDIHRFKYFRFVYCNDIVPRLPTDDSTFLFKHFGTCLYYDSFYKAKVVPEEPHKNYISLLLGIPRLLNAFWELIRGFILQYIRGPDYREGWLLILVRFVGLALPGLAAHSPQDYVNATRLGPSGICKRPKDSSTP